MNHGFSNNESIAARWRKSLFTKNERHNANQTVEQPNPNHKIIPTKVEASKDPPEHPVFGITLEELMKRENESGNIPSIVIQLVEHIKASMPMKGIFRVPGDNIEMNELKDMYNRGIEVDLNKLGDSHSAPGLLKLFFRELADPLIPQFMYHLFIEAQASTTDVNLRLNNIRKLVHMIPEPNKTVLFYLAEFLHNCSKYSEETKMTASNLAIVMGPTLLRPREESLYQMFEHARYVNSIAKAFIEEYEFIFGSLESPKGGSIDNDKELEQISPEFQEDIKKSLSKRNLLGDQVVNTDWQKKK